MQKRTKPNSPQTLQVLKNAKSRISGKPIRTEVATYSRHGSECWYFDDTLSLAFMHLLRLTDEEYDQFLENASDEILDLLAKEEWTFHDKRIILRMIEAIKPDNK